MASYKFKKNGKVEISITYGSRYDGKRKRYYRTVEYVNDKKLELDTSLFLAEIMNGDITAGDSTTINAIFNDFMQNNGGINSDLKESTAIRYKTLYDNQIRDYIGHRKLKDITKVMIRDWVNDLSSNALNKKTGRPLAPKTVKNALSLLSTLFKYAIEDLDIIDFNPCQNVRVPKQPKSYQVKELYSDAEVIDLISCLMREKENNPVHVTLIELILFTGLRTGEAMGLRWSDVDWDNKSIHIERERIMAQGKIIVDTPKTADSVRFISLPDFLIAELKELRRIEREWAIKDSRIFNLDSYISIKPDGIPYRPYATYEWFKKFQSRYELKNCTIHDLRHTHAAMLSSIGVEIIDVSKRLGHSNTRVTQEVYEYYFKKTDADVSNKIDNYYNNVININAV